MSKKWKNILNSSTVTTLLITLGVVLSLLIMFQLGWLRLENFYSSHLSESLIRFNVSLVTFLYLCSLMIWTLRNKERDIIPLGVAVITPMLTYIFFLFLALFWLLVTLGKKEYGSQLIFEPIVCKTLLFCCLALSIRLTCQFQKPKSYFLKKRIGRILPKTLVVLSIFSFTISSYDFPGIISQELRNTKIAFVHNDRIYSINANGSDVTDLTNMGYVKDGFPTWSPDSQQIAFQSSTQVSTYWSDIKYVQIYRMNADGSGRVPLTPNSSNNREPTWSPNSQQISFVSNRDGNSEIYVMNADGSNPQRLTNNPAKDIQPDWSPDGKSIAFVSDRDGYEEIYTMNVDGSELRRVTYGENHEYVKYVYPNWSPDGQQIAFSSGESQNSWIYIINVDGSQLQEIARGTHPTWSPNGRAIAFIGQQYIPDFWDPGGPVSNGLWIVNLDNLDYKIAVAPDFEPRASHFQTFHNPSWGPFPSKQ